MKIAVINFAASSGGALSILKDFYNYIKENDDGNEWIFFLSEKYIEETKNIKIVLLDKYKQNWFYRLKFDYIDGKKIIDQFKVDRILNFQNTIVHGIDKKQILYVHQSLPFQKVKKFSFFKKNEFTMAVYQNLIGILIKSSIKKSDAVIVQTKWMKESMINMKLCDENKVKVIPPEINIDIDKYKNKKLKNKRFFFPAGKSIYKNHEVIVLAAETLIKEGISDFHIEFTLDKSNSNKFVKCIGNIDREQIMKKYSEEILIFPSYIETYGLPLAECKLCNGVVFAADTEFAHEILDGYENAYFFNFNSYKDIALLMKKAIKGQIVRKNIYNIIDKNINGWNEVINIIKNGGQIGTYK